MAAAMVAAPLWLAAALYGEWRASQRRAAAAA
jgi:hypothetical protein